MDRVAILGDGLLGSELFNQTGWDVYSRKKNQFDITNTLSFNELIDWSEDRSAGARKYDTLINCIAFTKTYSNDREPNWNVNYKGVSDLVDFCNVWNIKLIQISTDHIYANSESEAAEESIPQPIPTWYGYTKMLGDAHVQLKSKDYLLVRESHKPYPFPYKEAWSNQYTNGDYVPVIAKLIVELISKDAKGIYNVGTEIKTWFNYTKEEFSTQPTTRSEQAPADITMNLTKLKNALKGTDK